MRKLLIAILILLMSLLTACTQTENKTQEVGKKGDTMSVEKIGTLKYTEMVLKIDAKDHEIPATVCIPGGEGVHPVIVMLHGTGSNRNEVGNGYQIAAKELAGKFGMATIRIDFMGNGDSNALYENYNFTTAVNDAMSAINYIKGVDTIDTEKIGIMGWSQGGSIAMLTASQYGDQIKSIVTWAGATDLTGLFNDTEYNEAKENGYFVREYDWREPLHFGLQWCNDAKNTDILKEFSKYTGPVLAIAGSKDNVVSPNCAKEIVATSQSKNSETYFIEGMDHTFNVFSEADNASLYKAVEKTGEFFKQTLN